MSVLQSVSWEQGCILPALPERELLLVLAELRLWALSCGRSAAAKHREPELPEHSSPAELPALNICNSKYEIFVSHFFFPQHVKKEALLIDFSAIFLWHMP